MRTTTYIHYGSDRFDPAKFEPIRNLPYRVKPDGGLWASPVSAQRSWKAWCEENEFYMCRLAESFRFTLSEDARVFHLFSSKQLAELPKAPGEVPVTWSCIDFEKAKDDYDAIELHLSEEEIERGERSLYWELYGWDCDSILIMNPDVIRPIG